MLIKSNSELRAHMGGAINTSLGVGGGDDENDRILNFVPIAEGKYIKKAISPEMYAELDAAYNGTITVELQPLFDLVQKATAFYTYGEYLAYALLEEGDTGLAGDDKKSAKMWQYYERLNKTFELASDMIELALDELFTGNYTAFKNSDTFSGLYGLLINSGAVLRRALPPSGGSYRFLLTLWPYLADVEARELIELMGSATYEGILAIRNGTAKPTDANADVKLKLLFLSEKVVGHAAYVEALPQGLQVVISGEGSLRVLSEFDGIRNRKNPTDEQFDRLLRSVREKRDQLRAELKGFLDKNKDVFPDYAANFYKEGHKPAFLRAEEYTTIFPLR
jgi:hypothetical protein